jgi:hypothetical protein
VIFGYQNSKSLTLPSVLDEDNGESDDVMDDELELEVEI